MAEPGEAVFSAPAFPRVRQRRGAATWWGKAWQRSAEESAYDEADLRRGRALARSGRLGPVTVESGRASARVSVEDGSVLAELVVTELDHDVWVQFAAEVTRQSGHIADLLAGQLTPELVEAADQLGLEVLPGPERIESRCECGHWVQPCQHTLALAVQVGWLVDQDPLLLLWLQGCPRDRLLGLVTGEPVEDPALADTATRAAQILALAEQAPSHRTGGNGGLADAEVAAYDAAVARLLR